MTPIEHPAARGYRERTGTDHPHVKARTEAELTERLGMPVHLDERVPQGMALIVQEPPPPRLVFPVRLAIGSKVYDLGSVAGSDPEEISEELAARCEELAKLLRGPEHSPAPPCEGCGSAMVFRRGHPGRFVPMGQQEDGSPFVYGIHDVGTCAMDRDLRSRRGGW